MPDLTLYRVRGRVFITPYLARCIALDAAKAHMRAAGRVKFNRADQAVYVAEYYRLRPLVPEGEPCDTDGGPLPPLPKTPAKIGKRRA